MTVKQLFDTADDEQYIEVRTADRNELVLVSDYIGGWKPTLQFLEPLYDKEILELFSEIRDDIPGSGRTESVFVVGVECLHDQADNAGMESAKEDSPEKSDSRKSAAEPAGERAFNIGLKVEGDRRPEVVLWPANSKSHPANIVLLEGTFVTGTSEFTEDKAWGVVQQVNDIVHEGNGFVAKRPAITENIVDAAKVLDETRSLIGEDETPVSRRLVRKLLGFVLDSLRSSGKLLGVDEASLLAGDDDML